MLEAFDELVGTALVRLAEEDQRTSGVAGAAFRMLTGDRGAGFVTRHELEMFLWHRLPARWPDAPGSAEEVAAALARLLELSGLPRYARVCRSRTTLRILARYRRGPEQGREAAGRAVDRSPVTPPDLAQIAWSADMGPEEMDVFSSRWSIVSCTPWTRRRTCPACTRCGSCPTGRPVRTAIGRSGSSSAGHE